MSGITWTKLWAGIDDGTILRGIDLRNIQQDLAGVLTTADYDNIVADAADDAVEEVSSSLLFYESSLVEFNSDAVFI